MQVGLVNDGPVTLEIESVKDPKGAAKYLKTKERLSKQKSKGGKEKPTGQKEELKKEEDEDKPGETKVAEEDGQAE